MFKFCLCLKVRDIRFDFELFAFRNLICLFVYIVYIVLGIFFLIILRKPLTFCL